MSPQFIADAQETIREILTTLSCSVSGDLTLNQIRVLQFINLCTKYRGEATSHMQICSELSLPSATVTRAIGKFLEANIISEHLDPDDGRRRIVAIIGINQNLDIELAEMTERMASLTMQAPAAEGVDKAFIAQSQELICEIFTTISRVFSGNLTLNQVRVLQFINLCWRHRGVGWTSHIQICSELNLPSATVSRAVAKFIQLGVVGEEVDPDDGRKRFVVGTGVIPGAHENDLDLALARLITRQPDDQP